jgi:Domain of unknown function (DUF1707)
MGAAMVTGSGDDLAATAAGRGHLRASLADREQVIGTLKAAFVQGMLAKDEFDLRVSQAFTSRTYAELAAVTVDLPAEPTAAQQPKPARAQGKRRLLRPGPVIMAATALYAGIWAPAFLLPPGPANPEGDPPRALILLFISSNVIYPLVLVIALVFMVAGWREKRSGRRPPRRPAPGAGGQESGRLLSADLGGELPPVDRGHLLTAETERSRPPPAAKAGSRSPRRWCPRGLLAVTAGNRRAMSV